MVLQLDQYNQIMLPQFSPQVVPHILSLPHQAHLFLVGCCVLKGHGVLNFFVTQFDCPNNEKTSHPIMIVLHAISPNYLFTMLWLQMQPQLHLGNPYILLPM